MRLAINSVAAFSLYWLANLVYAFELNQAEQDYLDKKDEILICVDPDWMPFEAIENGQHIGIAAEYFAEFAAFLGTRFTLVPTNSWPESLGKVASGQCDLVTLLDMTDEREKFLNFTDPYLTAPLVLVTHQDNHWFDDLNSLRGKTLAMPAEYAYEGWVRRDYPDIDIVFTANQTEAIKQVSIREADAAIGVQLIMLRALQELSVANVRVISFTDYTDNLRIGVVKDDPILRDIMAKAVASIDQDKEHEILKNWYSFQIEKEVDRTVIWMILAGASAVFLVLFLQIRGVHKYNQLLQEKNTELEHLSETDHLTGAYNRLKTDRVIHTEVVRAERYGTDFSVILFDVDHFKVVNDNSGHQTGDEILKGLVSLVQRNIRETDVLGRWGGEEFMLVTPELTAENAASLAEKLRELVAQYSFYTQVKVTVSMGVATYHHGDSPDKLLSLADQALYEAKRAGRNRVVLA